jgi:ankyrin repeat protein
MDNEPVMLQRINQFGRTPLHMTCLFKASATTISLLLKRYPQALDIHDKKDGYTPLHLACENGASAEVAMLLLMAASPWYAVSRSQNESTPLHLACSKTNAKSLEQSC